MFYILFNSWICLHGVLD